MKICLYGASSNDIAHLYISATEKLGEKIAANGHSLVYGGGACGLMGAAARGVVKNRGKVIGIAPSFFNVDGVLFKGCTEMIYTDTMRERKQLMEQKADAFVAVPGGIGTFDELFEIMTLKQLGRHKKPIAIFNINGYFDELINMLNKAVNHGFMTEGCKKLAPAFSAADRLIAYLESSAFATEDYDLKEFKDVFRG